MCNIAGYIGSKQAAPIIVEMLRKQEGWDSGYYTGIATIHDGKLYMEKDACNLETLLQQTDITKLPGTVGIIHGRSKGTDDHRYAHPFIGTGGKIAYIANGWGGIFREDRSKIPEIYQELTELGYRCTSEMVGDYKMIPGGKKVHSSDLKCQNITRNVDNGMSMVDAIEKAYCDRCAEVVGLALYTEEPDRITFARINYPMFIGVADHGIYLATTPMVIPEDARDITLLNPLSAGQVFKDHYTVKPFKNPPCTVAPLTPEVYHACYEALLKELSQRDMDHDEIDRFLRPRIPGGDCPPESALDYMILHDLQKQGRLVIKTTEMPGVKEGSVRTKFIASLKKS